MGLFRKGMQNYNEYDWKIAQELNPPSPIPQSSLSDSPKVPDYPVFAKTNPNGSFTYSTDNFNEYLEYRIRLYEDGIRDLYDVERWFIHPGSGTLASSDVSAPKGIDGTGVPDGDAETQELYGTTKVIKTESQIPDMDDPLSSQLIRWTDDDLEQAYYRGYYYDEYYANNGSCTFEEFLKEKKEEKGNESKV